MIAKMVEVRNNSIFGSTVIQFSKLNSSIIKLKKKGNYFSNSRKKKMQHSKKLCPLLTKATIHSISQFSFLSQLTKSILNFFVNYLHCLGTRKLSLL